MLDSTVVTITLVIDPDGTRNIYTTFGSVPAKTMDEADQALSDSNVNESELIDKIVSAVPSFADAEPGSEEYITRTLVELSDEFGFTLEENEEIVGKDLDNDNEEGPDDTPEHIEIVNKTMGDDLDDSEDVDLYDPFGATKVENYITDPLAYSLADSVELDYDPITNLLDEGASAPMVGQLLISRASSSTHPTPLRKLELKEILAANQVFNDSILDTVVATLLRALELGSIKIGLYMDELVLGRIDNSQIAPLQKEEWRKALINLVKNP